MRALVTALATGTEPLRSGPGALCPSVAIHPPRPAQQCWARCLGSLNSPRAGAR